MGNSSSLPASIPKLRNIFDKSVMSAKLNAGPTFPSPGPMLLNVAATALKAVRKSSVVLETIKSNTVNIQIYTIKSIIP